MSRYSTSSDGEIFTSAKFLWLRSKIKIVWDNSLTIKEVFKNEWEDFFISDLILAQVKHLWEDVNKINTITLDDVINTEIISNILEKGEQYVINNWWKNWSLDKMTWYLLQDIWKEIKEVRIFTELQEGVKVYNIRLTIE